MALFFGTTTTHRSWFKGTGKKLWGIEPDALKGKLPKFLPDVPEVREDVADYLGECQAVDAYIGALLERLAAAENWKKPSSFSAAITGCPASRGASAIFTTTAPR